MPEDAENTEIDPSQGSDFSDDYAPDSEESVPGPRRRSDLRTALAVAMAALLVVGVVVGGGLAWAFWSFSRTTASLGPAGSPEPMSPAGTITPAVSDETTTMPDLVALELGAATAKLQRIGFVQGAVTRVFVDGFPLGTVIAQTPAAGTAAPLGSEVALTVCQGSLTAEMPRVVGMSVGQAKKTLASVGLSVSVVHSVYDDRVASGLVMSVAANGSSQPKRGDSVSLVVSKGRVPVAMPAITGMAPAQAKTACARAGLGLTLQPAGASGGIVYRQSPAAGTGIAPGSSAVAWVDTPPTAAIAARLTKLDPTWEKYNKSLGAHVTCTATARDDRGVASVRWQVEGLDVSMSGTGNSISFILPGYRKYGSTSVTLTVVDSAGQTTTVRRLIRMNWDTGTLQ